MKCPDSEVTVTDFQEQNRTANRRESAKSCLEASEWEHSCLFQCLKTPGSTIVNTAAAFPVRPNQQASNGAFQVNR